MDAQNNTTRESSVLMGVLAYLGPLLIISYLTSKNDPFVKFHIKQGLVLLVIEIIVWVIGMMFMWQVWMLLRLVNFLTLILAVIGIINVIQKKEKMLPVVGHLASHFKF